MELDPDHLARSPFTVGAIDALATALPGLVLGLLVHQVIITTGLP